MQRLKPCFFRFGADRVLSGWRSPNGDYWATSETLMEAKGVAVLACESSVVVYSPEAPGVLLARRARPALQIGERLVFTKAVDLHPLVFIKEGEQCVVGRACKTTGAVELFMADYHATLDEYSNCVTVEPHCSDDVLGALAVHHESLAAPVAVEDAAAVQARAPAAKSRSLPVRIEHNRRIC